MFQFVDVERAVAVEYHEVVPVSLVVSEKQILAVLRAVGVPVLAGDLYRRGLGVRMVAVPYAVSVEIVENLLHAFHKISVR